MMSSIRARMTLTFTAIAALLLLVLGSGLVWFARQTAEREADSLLRSAASQFRAEVGNGGRRAILSEMAEETAQRRSQGITLALYDRSGNLVSATDRELPAAPRAAHPAWRTVPLQFGSDTVVFGMPWVKTERDLRREAFGLAALCVVVLLGTGAGAWVLVGRTLSPIELLSRQAARASADLASVRLSAPSDDAEVVTLVGTLNGFLDRLYEATAARHRFYAAASHELRTPLQALQGHLELALTRKRPPEEYEAAIEEAREQAGYLSRLVQDLLALNRLQSGTGQTPRERVDLVSVVERVAEAYAPLAERRAVHLALDIPDDSQTFAPETHVEMVVRNLVENAVKYSKPEGRVDIRLTKGPAPELSIVNETGPCEPLDRDRLFEPFYRPDADRHSETGGNGLGLALCKTAADANGWVLALHQDAATVTVTVAFRGNSGV
ncbi:MAG TPA: HAMP domain-containing sensor histidine kinase [Armatimonadota bacterium]|jgi:signal transduction histidine kinase